MFAGEKRMTGVGQLNRLAGFAIVLALLHFGREVLIPITLALILSVFIAPLVRSLRRIGLGHTSSIAFSVLLLTLCSSAIGLVVGAQLVRLGSSLPQYENVLRGKIQTLDELTLGKLSTLTGQADRIIGKLGHGGRTGEVDRPAFPESTPEASPSPVPVLIQEPEPRPVQLLRQIVKSIFGPLEMAGMVFVVLIFVLLEHEALRDRFIRLVGNGNLRATTIAVNDASERLSRFFISQLLVNIMVGVMIWIGLAIAGLPQALLWGTIAGLLRFVPYVGIWIAGFGAVLLATAITPGWSVVIVTIALFVAVEIIVSQLVEPRLYGHTTGLSPLSVVISAIFWSWIWGPIGLVLSTPLTLCLVVAGRYIPSLNFLEILLGEVRALTLPENFYQRALSGDAQEIMTGARRFLRKKPLSAYCDTVLIPAMHLAIADFSQQEITHAEQLKVNNAIATVLIGLEDKRHWWRPAPSISVLEGTSLARQLRERRENQIGQWQGPVDVPAGTVVLGIGAGSFADELAAELLVRVLRARRLDGRHLSFGDLDAEAPPPGTTAEAVAVVCLVSVVVAGKNESLTSSVASIRQRLPKARVVVLSLSSPFDTSHARHEVPEADLTVHSYSEIAQTCLDLLAGTEDKETQRR